MLKIKKDNKTIAYLKIKDPRVVQTVDAEFTLNFTCTVQELKTQYLNDRTCELELDGNRYKVARLETVKQKGANTTYSVYAEHLSYGLIEKLYDKYSVTGTPQAHLTSILSGTGFAFLGTDIIESREITVDLTNARYLINRLAREFGATLKFDGMSIGLYKAQGQDLPLTLSVNGRLDNISRSDNFATQQVTYRVDVDGLNMKEYETIYLHDTVRVVDDELQLDDRRKVIRTEYNPLTQRNNVIELGDIQADTFVDDILDLVEENIELPDNVITEVIHQQVINVETAHILNAWIKNLFVQYLETNFDALVPSNPTTERLYVRVINNEFSFIEAKLSPTDVEPLLIADPNGNGGKVNVYYTAIGEHPDAYRYFTITNPKNVHKDLTDAEAEAFRVLVKKTLNENVKMKISFKEVELSNGTRTVTPVMTLGIGSDPTGGTTRGIGEIFKDILGVCLKQNLEINDTWCGFRLNSTTGAAEYRNPITGEWIDLSNITVGGTGNNVYWLDKTVFDASMFTNSNCNHYGINTTTTDKVVGQYSTLYKPSAITFLGIEQQTVAPPVEALPNILYKNGNENESLTGGWVQGYKYVSSGSSGNISKTSNSMKIQGNLSGYNPNYVDGYATFNKINFNGFKYLCIRGSVSGANPGLQIRLAQAPSAENAIDLSPFMTSGQTMIKYDISTYQGSYNVQCLGNGRWALGSYTCEYFEIWLE